MYYWFNPSKSCSYVCTRNVTKAPNDRHLHWPLSRQDNYSMALETLRCRHGGHLKPVGVTAADKSKDKTSCGHFKCHLVVSDQRRSACRLFGGWFSELYLEPMLSWVYMRKFEESSGSTFTCDVTDRTATTRQCLWLFHGRHVLTSLL